MPGSPPTNTKEPFTKPPPRTLSNSPIPVWIRIASFPTTSFNDLGVTTFFSVCFPGHVCIANFSS